MTRILVVDDKPENLYYLEVLLSAHGYTVDRAQHGAEALVRARAVVPDMVVSDLLMPVMDGYSLLRHWKADHRLQRVPFVVYTATYTEPEDERLALALGADAFILKPAEPDQLIARIREVEAAARGGTPARATPRLDDEPDLLEVYSRTLVRKLEEKSLQLEQANQQLKQEIAERRQIAELQSALLAAMGDGLFGLALDGTVTFENEAALQMLGWAKGELVGVVNHDLVHHHRADGTPYPAADCPIHRTILDGRTRHVNDEVFFRRDGTSFPVEYTCAPMRSENGQLSGVVVSFRDVTASRESETRFRQLAETITQVFWISDLAKDGILYVSPAYETIWGRSTADLYNDASNWLQAIHPDDRSSVEKALTLRATGAYNLNYRIVRPDGTIRWIHDRAFPLRDAEGRAYRVVGTAEDITERKAMEEQFLRAQRMESLGTMAGGIAHDLNNVLTPILMSIDLLKQKDSPVEQAQTIATIEASAKKGADMVRQVLSFARGVEGRRQDVDVRELLQDVARIGNDTFLKSIEVEVSVPDELPHVLGDPTQLHQVLLNLCVNARDAMPEGGRIRLAARLETMSPDRATQFAARSGPYVVLEVSDTGVGIAPAILERIFEPFFTTKAPGKGTGLGLSTSLAIVKSHGGFLDVHSTPGDGTTFEVHLPASLVAGRGANAAAQGRELTGNGQLVLVVDDEASIREMSRRLLERHGYRVLLADDGTEALAQFRQHQHEIALVITDMMMPVMNGVETVRALRTLDPNVRVIAVSGLEEALDLSAFQGPGEGVRRLRSLAKPYTTVEFLGTVRDALRDEG